MCNSLAQPQDGGCNMKAIVRAWRVETNEMNLLWWVVTLILVATLLSLGEV